MTIDNLVKIIMYFLAVVSLIVLPRMSSASEVGAINVTGSYISNITGTITALNIRGPKPEVKLVQDGKKITGTFGGPSGGALFGEIEGRTINFEWQSARDNGRGEWIIKPNSNELIGKWSSYWLGEGNWNLIRTSTEESPRTPEITNKTDNSEMVQAASGTGFAVSSKGHVVTNNHVIDGCTYVNIQYRGKAIRSTILYRDPINDLAVLQGDFVPTNIFKISRRNPEIMQEVFVAGYPFGNHVSSSVKVTKGIVSSLSGLGNNVSNLQIDAALQPGNSGGPIFDSEGNVIGVAVAKLDYKKVVENWGVIPENTNFGIKSNVVVNMLESNGIKFHEASNKSLSNAELGKMMRGATYHLSCWMTMAQVRKMATSKVLFPDLTN